MAKLLPPGLARSALAWLRTVIGGPSPWTVVKETGEPGGGVAFRLRRHRTRVSSLTLLSEDSNLTGVLLRIIAGLSLVGGAWCLREALRRFVHARGDEGPFWWVQGEVGDNPALFRTLDDDVVRGAPCPRYSLGRGSICLPLLRHLRLYSCFVKRDYGLLLTLRNRAIVWCKEHEVSDRHAEDFIPTTVAEAFKLGPSEQRALASLSSYDTKLAVESSTKLAAGNVPIADPVSIMDVVTGRRTIAAFTRARHLQLSLARVQMDSG